MAETQPDLENWDDFRGRYFKPENAKEWPCTVLVNKVDSRINEDDRPQLVLEVVYMGKKFLFEPNITNTGIIRAAVPIGPKLLPGKKLVFDKIKARNPTTKQMVDSLQISKVE